MSTFRFEAVNAKGERIAGEVEAKDREEAKANVIGMSLFPTRIVADGPGDPKRVFGKALQQAKGNSILLWFLAGLIPLAVFGIGSEAGMRGREVMLLTFVVAAVTLLSAWLLTLAIYASTRLRVGRALADGGNSEEAVRMLKPLTRGAQISVSTSDEATYEIARAYDRGGQLAMAREAYRDYLQRYKKGMWSMEARVRLEELEAKGDLNVQLEQSLKAELRCPYCKDDLADDAWECPECHTPHHEACYAEASGCATYGCGRAAERRVAE